MPLPLKAPAVAVSSFSITMGDLGNVFLGLDNILTFRWEGAEPLLVCEVALPPFDFLQYVIGQ